MQSNPFSFLELPHHHFRTSSVSRSDAMESCVSAVVRSFFSCLDDMFGGALSYLRTLAAGRVANLLRLEENADTLDRETRVLTEIRRDLENTIRNLERQPRMRRTHRVTGWLASVDALGGEVRRLQDSLAERSTSLERCSCDSLHSGCVLGGKVTDLLMRVREISGQKNDLNGQLVDEGPPAAVVPVPSRPSWIVGGEKTLSEIRGYIEDQGVGIVGIYGMGGIGKTTFLTEINNQFVIGGSTGDFDVVIFVTISKEANIFKIQEDISLRLGYTRRGDSAGCSLPENEDDRKLALYTALVGKRFLLLLDDLWERLEMERIGVPRPNSLMSSGQKIVFTTRLEEVCADMDAQRSKVRVSFLDEEESWRLFCSKMDDRVDLRDDSEIRPLAKTVVGKCGGLPLALITMGRAMSNATRVGEWNQAMLRLEQFPNRIRGMEDVLSILRFSFDRLEDRTAMECLLYCSIFPEDYVFGTKQLIDYWVGEGFLDGEVPDSGSLAEARDRGEGIIGKLRDVCLLEGGDDEGEVKMHDVVREMALWLTGGEFDKEQRFIVCGEKGPARLEEIKMWADAKRISMVQEDVRGLPSLSSTCPNLSTILISSKFLDLHGEISVPERFFESLPALRVLDLSGVCLKELPDAIGLLAELRHLNLSMTGIRRLPEGLGKLVKLRNLDLRFTRDLLSIPRESISTLTRLQALDLHESGYSWDVAEGGITLDDIEGQLRRLEELSVSIHTSSALDKVAKSEMLQMRTWEIQLREIGALASDELSAALERLEGLKVLWVQDCHELETLKVVLDCRLVEGLRELSLSRLGKLKEVVGVERVRKGRRGGGGAAAGSALLRRPPLFPFLRELETSYCSQLKDLRWVGELPHLEWLWLSDCKGIEALLVNDGVEGEPGEDDGGAMFRRLKKVALRDLPALRSISSGVLLFPSLESLWIRRCPKLKSLPLGGRSCRKIKKIEVEAEWWGALEWADCEENGFSSTRDALTPFFEALPYSSGSEDEDE